VLAKAHSVYHDRDLVQIVRRRAISSASAVSVAATNRQDRIDFEVDAAKICPWKTARPSLATMRTASFSSAHGQRLDRRPYMAHPNR
jgi:hypothetical protein